MAALTDVIAGTVASAFHVQQIIDALKGTPNKGVPVALVALNDATNYALTVQNDDPTNTRALLVLKADGTTLIAADVTGVTLGSPLNIAAGSIGTASIADGSITAAKLAPGTPSAETLFAGATAIASANYTVTGQTMWVFCTTTLTVTLPVVNTNRPISVGTNTGVATPVTVVAASGSVFGGSLNPSTGAVMNGQVAGGDTITYKSDGTNWRAV